MNRASQQKYDLGAEKATSDLSSYELAGRIALLQLR